LLACAPTAYAEAVRGLAWLSVLGLAGCEVILGIGDLKPKSQEQPDAHPGPETPDGGPSGFMFTVNKASDATGTGTVTSAPLGLSCDASCTSKTATFDSPIAVLKAVPAPGSYFQGWTGACNSPSRSCTVGNTSPNSVTARFSTIDHNLVFVSSKPYQMNTGGLAGADTLCQGQAQLAGLTGTWKAILSDDSTNAFDRLVVPGTSTPSRGFMRMDGAPIGDTIANLISGPIWVPVVFDENGMPWLQRVWTGTQAGGTRSNDCTNWTGVGSGFFGDPYGGAVRWYYLGAAPACGCGGLSVYCAMTDKSSSISPVPVAGKKIWLSQAHFASGGGLAAADAQCDGDKPAGVGAAKALLATTTTPASALLGADVTYVRPDGILVGKGADMADPMGLHSGIWQHSDGSYATTEEQVWSGSLGVDKTGTVASTCNDWMNNTGGMPFMGLPLFASGDWWHVEPPAADCTQQAKLYCFEP
jgi:hypothetical protein